jgi:hypothetical protein
MKEKNIMREKLNLNIKLPIKLFLKKLYSSNEEELSFSLE